MFQFFFLLIFTFCTITEAATFEKYSVGANLRSYPLGATVLGTARKDILAWGEKTDSNLWKYGYGSAIGQIGAHGFYEAGLAFAPVSLIEVSAFMGGTSRFYDTRGMDCSVYNCRGHLQRQKFQVKVNGGYQEYFGQVLGISTQNTLDDKSKMGADEADHLVFNPEGDRLETGIMILGRKFEDFRLGLMVREAGYRSRSEKAQAQYLFLALNQGLRFAVGHYYSPYYSSNISVLFSTEMFWGESLSF